MSLPSKNSFSSRAALKVGGDSFDIYRLDAIERAGVGNVARLPFSLKVFKDRYSTIYGAYYGTEMTLNVPMPTHMSGNSQAGGLAQAYLKAAGDVDANGYKIFGYLVLESDSGNRRVFNIISNLNTLDSLTPINATAVAAMFSAEISNALISSQGAPESPKRSFTPIEPVITGIPYSSGDCVMMFETGHASAPI